MKLTIYYTAHFFERFFKRNDYVNDSIIVDDIFTNGNVGLIIKGSVNKLMKGKQENMDVYLPNLNGSIRVVKDKSSNHLKAVTYIKKILFQNNTQSYDIEFKFETLDNKLKDFSKKTV